MHNIPLARASGQLENSLSGAKLVNSSGTPWLIPRIVLPRAFNTSQEDYQRHGFTQRCPGCRAILLGTTRQRDRSEDGGTDLTERLNKRAKEMGVAEEMEVSEIIVNQEDETESLELWRRGAVGDG